MLRFASFYTSPDAKADAEPTYNPFDSISSLIQQFVYLTSLFFLIARGKTSVRVALRDPLVWTLPILTMLSFLWSDFPDISLRKGITTLQTTYFGLYVASRFTIKQQLQMLGWVLGITAVFSFFFTLAFPGVAIEAGANAGSWRGPFTQKNLLARLMVLGAIVFLLLALDRPKSPKLLWGGFGICVLMVILTGSKTALLLLFTIIILLPFYKLLRAKDTIIIPAIVGLIIIGSSVITFVTENWLTILAALGRDATLSGRTTLWEVALEKISERFWLGYGYQSFWLDGGGAMIIWKIEGYKPPHAHNGFINMALDLGVIGLFLFLTILLVNYIRSIIWLRIGKTVTDLWPIFYITFFFMYNHSENTIIEHNSIFWSLLVTVSLSMRRVKLVKRQITAPELLNSQPPINSG
ncbi:O-antigen ligase family protein [Floridanema fluviatile]